MSEKVPYSQAMVGVCALNGWIARYGEPTVRNLNGETVLTLGSIVLITRDSDIRSEWDPMDYDRQIRARDKLASELRKRQVEHMAITITPPMWQVA